MRSVKHLARRVEGQRASVPVKCIADDSMADVGEGDADLMQEARLDSNLDEGDFSQVFENPDLLANRVGARRPRPNSIFSGPS